MPREQAKNGRRAVSQDSASKKPKQSNRPTESTIGNLVIERDSKKAEENVISEFFKQAAGNTKLQDITYGVEVEKYNVKDIYSLAFIEDYQNKIKRELKNKIKTGIGLHEDSSNQDTAAFCIIKAQRQNGLATIMEVRLDGEKELQVTAPGNGLGQTGKVFDKEKAKATVESLWEELKKLLEKKSNLSPQEVKGLVKEFLNKQTQGKKPIHTMIAIETISKALPVDLESYSSNSLLNIFSTAKTNLNSRTEVASQASAYNLEFVSVKEGIQKNKDFFDDVNKRENSEIALAVNNFGKAMEDLGAGLGPHIMVDRISYEFTKLGQDYLKGIELSQKRYRRGNVTSKTTKAFHVTHSALVMNDLTYIQKLDEAYGRRKPKLFKPTGDPLLDVIRKAIPDREDKVTGDITGDRNHSTPLFKSPREHFGGFRDADIDQKTGPYKHRYKYLQNALLPEGSKERVLQPMSNTIEYLKREIAEYDEIWKELNDESIKLFKKIHTKPKSTEGLSYDKAQENLHALNIKQAQEKKDNVDKARDILTATIDGLNHCIDERIEELAPGQLSNYRKIPKNEGELPPDYITLPSGEKLSDGQIRVFNSQDEKLQLLYHEAVNLNNKDHPVLKGLIELRSHYSQKREHFNGTLIEEGKHLDNGTALKDTIDERLFNDGETKNDQLIDAYAYTTNFGEADQIGKDKIATRLAAEKKDQVPQNSEMAGVPIKKQGYGSRTIQIRGSKERSNYNNQSILQNNSRALSKQSFRLGTESIATEYNDSQSDMTTSHILSGYQGYQNTGQNHRKLKDGSTEQTSTQLGYVGSLPRKPSTQKPTSDMTIIPGRLQHDPDYLAAQNRLIKPQFIGNRINILQNERKEIGRDMLRNQESPVRVLQDSRDNNQSFSQAGPSNYQNYSIPQSQFTKGTNIQLGAEQNNSEIRGSKNQPKNMEQMTTKKTNQTIKLENIKLGSKYGRSPSAPRNQFPYLNK